MIPVHVVHGGTPSRGCASSREHRHKTRAAFWKPVTAEANVLLRLGLGQGQSRGRRAPLYGLTAI